MTIRKLRGTALVAFTAILTTTMTAAAGVATSVTDRMTTRAEVGFVATIAILGVVADVLALVLARRQIRA